ncbi:MAG: hydroxymethylglutaryl-CoA lyase [Sporomusaceae bacterium]|nr:hydroxymethylglutaryl-CoA lyase [Sporomusaceae bacterium]
MLHLPQQVEVIDVGPRDGFQNIKEWIPTEVKMEIIDGLMAAGVKSIEVTSFVHPKAIPQMADATTVAAAALEKYQQVGLKAKALVPNLQGAKKAYSQGIREVTYVISASEKHNLANINRTREQSLADLAAIIKELPDLTIRLAAATSFGCPFAGQVPEELVLSLIQSAVDLGVNYVVLCDTIGVGDPKQVYSLVQAVKTNYPNITVALHLHDTRGMGLANTLAGLEAGITVFESAIGGLGGCPFAPGAAGNTATEDMINMFHRMGIQTGIDLDQYLSVVEIVKTKIQPVLTGHLASACKYDNL